MRTNPDASALASNVAGLRIMRGWTIGQTAAAIGIAFLAVLIGALSAISPFIAVSLAAAAAVLALAFLAPTTHLMLFVLVTAIVPFSLQNVAGAGLIPSDALLLSGLLAGSLRLLQTPLDRRRHAVAAIMVAFLLIAAFQVLHGLQAGRGAAQVGFEFRVLLGFGAVLMAMPLLVDPQGRRRLSVGLLVVGLLLGLWGLVQWVVNIPEINESGIGVRAGVRYASDAKGQIQGGLYGFPVAVILAAAVLMSGAIRSPHIRLAVIAVLGLNLVSLLLTYERTFWAATVVGLGLVTIRAGRARRFRAVVWGAVACVGAFAAFATVAPGELTAAKDRLLSIGQYGTDDSVRIRLLETELVLAEIRERPLAGSGLGATIFIGRPWQQVPPVSEWYIHNGYVWLAWKAGIIGAFLLLSVLGWAVVARGSPSGDPLWAALRSGSQAALLALLISSVMFPTFNGLAITATMGVLAAIAFSCRPPTDGQGAVVNRQRKPAHRSVGT